MQHSARDLSIAARQADALSAAAIATDMIGLGPGLTPAGDDYLVGFMAGLWSSAGMQMERQNIIASLGRGITRQAQKTNDISRTYLVHAARGQVSSRLADLAEAIQRGEGSNRLSGIAQAAIQVGHTSGIESAAGLLAGLSVWAA